MRIICAKETETPGFGFREFILTNTQTEEIRHVTHMQYMAWPDHGVPDDSIDFLNFVTKVREARTGETSRKKFFHYRNLLLLSILGMVEPTIVHCSAGIGRTGVLILMETAQCLIEANQPVYPLDIVRTMRDQRAMMIQTAVSFFVLLFFIPLLTTDVFYSEQSQYRFVCEAIQRVYAERLIAPLSEYQR